jgi:predicted cupin superfamily sugar epimerase
MTISTDAQYWIDTLALVRHPEGGFYRETYRSSDEIDGACLPERYHRNRAMATAIYFLLPSGERSKLHRLASDEIWHFHAGLPLLLTVIAPDRTCVTVTLGSGASRGERFQHVVEAGSWFGAEVAGDDGFALVSCTVAPGFDFADFEMGQRDDLLADFPEHRSAIVRLTDDRS